MPKKVLSILGSNATSLEEGQKEIAYEMGKLLAKEGYVIACGGLGGVMEEVCRGAKEIPQSLTIGILPSYDPFSANPYVDIILPTGLGFSRNTLVVSIGFFCIVIGGRIGTLSEVSFALQLRKPVCFLSSGGITALEELKNYLKKHYPSLLYFAKEPLEVLSYIQEYEKTAPFPPMPS